MRPLRIFRKLVWGDRIANCDEVRSPQSETSSEPLSPLTKSSRPLTRSRFVIGSYDRRSIEEAKKPGGEEAREHVLKQFYPGMRHHLLIPPHHRDSLEAYKELHVVKSTSKCIDLQRNGFVQPNLDRASFVAIGIPARQYSLERPIDTTTKSTSLSASVPQLTTSTEPGIAQEYDQPEAKKTKIAPRPVASRANLRRTSRQPKPVKLHDGMVILPWKKRRGKANDRSYKDAGNDETSPAPSPVLKSSKKSTLRDPLYRPKKFDEVSSPELPPVFRTSRKRKADDAPYRPQVTEECSAQALPRAVRARKVHLKATIKKPKAHLPAEVPTDSVVTIKRRQTSSGSPGSMIVVISKVHSRSN